MLPATSRPKERFDILRGIVTERYTCRAYLSDPVPDETIHGILDIARNTPSWCNVQPWHVTVTSIASTEIFRQELMKQAEITTGVDSDIEFPLEYQGIHKERRRETGYLLYGALGIEREDWKRRQAQAFENFRLFGAPHIAIITVEAQIGSYALVDCGAFIGNFLLAARAYGVDTTPQAAIAQHSAFIRSHFEIGKENHIVCGISFGYADKSHPANSFRTPRAPVDQILKIV